MIVRKNSITADGIIIGLDARGDINYLSHAHSDHIFKADEYLCSKETAGILNIKKWKNSLEKGDLRIRLESAGHIVGSTQILVENGSRFVYTGDFKLKRDIFGLSAGIIKCDHLMIESTYGSSEWRFPKRETTYQNIAHWLLECISRNESIIFGAYSLGKSQEIIKLMNNIGIIPLIHPKIENGCIAYDKYGFKTKRVVLGTKKAENLLEKTFIAVLPQNMVNRELATYISKESKKKVKTAIATGWALKYRRNVDKTFILSDHADFNDILRYIEESEAKEVYCVHGQNKKLANELRNRGINATAP